MSGNGSLACIFVSDSFDAALEFFDEAQCHQVLSRCPS